MEKEVLTIENSVVTKCDENAVDVVIPEGVTEIGGSAFSDCKSLSSVVIPASVTEIGNSAFRGCESLLSVVIPAGVTEIGESAFRNCYKLESIVIPPEVKKIGERAFYCCDSLKSVVISSPETKITAGAFGSCDSVSEIVFGGTKQQWKVVDKGFNLWEKEKLEFIKCSDGECRKRICSMEDGCLQSCLDFNVRKITIGDDVTKIGRYAFTSCDFLESVVIEEGVKEIENRAFFFQESLKSVKIPSTITKIGINAFRGCSAVEKIESDSPLFPFDEKTGKLYHATGKRRMPLLVLAKIIAKQKKNSYLWKISALHVISIASPCGAKFPSYSSTLQVFQHKRQHVDWFIHKLFFVVYIFLRKQIRPVNLA